MRTIDEDGEQWQCSFEDYTTGDLIPVVDGLGLLEAAKIDLMQQHQMIPMPPGQEGEYDDQ